MILISNGDLPYLRIFSTKKINNKGKLSIKLGVKYILFDTFTVVHSKNTFIISKYITRKNSNGNYIQC